MTHSPNDELLTAKSNRLKLSPTLAINELVQETRARGRKVVHLGFGEATFPIHAEVLRAHEEASTHTSYLPVAGALDLRKAIAKFQSRRLHAEIEPDQVVVAPGSKPLLFALFDILSGDVLLPRPSWVSYEPQVLHAQKKLFWIETSAKDRHSISEPALNDAYDAAVSEGGRPRIMLINSPSNPTGQEYSTAALDSIKRFCSEREIFLISDEIYSDISFGAGNSSPSSCSGADFNRRSTVLTGGLSKTYCAGGWRIGYAIFPKNAIGDAVRRTILAYASECWSAASAPAQFAATRAFSIDQTMDSYRAQVTSMHRYCTLRLYDALKTCGLDVAEPKGAFYVYPSFRPFSAKLHALGIETSLQLSRWLIEECGVAALPGTAFGERDDGPPHGRFRLRMATSYLYFSDEQDRYARGYDLLQRVSMGEKVGLPLLDEAIAAIQAAVHKLQEVKV